MTTYQTDLATRMKTLPELLSPVLSISVEAAEQVLKKAGSIYNIPKRTDILKEFAIGNGNLALFQAALELSERARTDVDQRQRIAPDKAGEQMASYFSRLQSLTHEEVWVVYMDRLGHIMDVSMETKGDENSAGNPNNLIARKCILSGASAIIVVHNHPTGSPRPSGMSMFGGGDIAVFKELFLLLGAIKVKLYDCVIVGDGSYWSGKESGELDRIVKGIVEEQTKGRGHAEQSKDMVDMLGSLT